MRHIVGVSIVGIELFGEKEDFNNVKFIIDFEKTSFVVSLRGTLLAHPCGKLQPRTDKVARLLCKDERGREFTLFDCSLIYFDAFDRILGDDKKDMVECFCGVEIIWGSVLHGKHFQAKTELVVDKLVCSLFNYNGVTFDTLNINIDFYNIEVSFTEYCSEFIITPVFVCNEPEQLVEVLFKLFTLHFICLGNYPEIAQLQVFVLSEPLNYHSSQIVGYTPSKRRAAHYILQHDYPLSKCSEWVALHKDILEIFTVFRYTSMNKNMLVECGTSLLLQCLEGYFRVKHSYKGTFREILKKALNYNKHTRKVFERDLKYELINKLCNHRNYMCHLNSDKEKDKYIADFNLNELVQEKLQLLFRLIILHDIGVDVKESDAGAYIKRIEKHFYK